MNSGLSLKIESFPCALSHFEIGKDLGVEKNIVIPMINFTAHSLRSLEAQSTRRIFFLFTLRSLRLCSEYALIW